MSEQVVHNSVAQRIVIRFLTNEGIIPSQIYSRLKNQFGDECLSKSRVYDWCKSFKEGRARVENEPHARRPKTSTDEYKMTDVDAIIRGNPRITVREIAEKLKISVGSVQALIKDRLKFSKASTSAEVEAESSEDMYETVFEKVLVEEDSLEDSKENTMQEILEAAHSAKRKRSSPYPMLAPADPLSKPTDNCTYNTSLKTIDTASNSLGATLNDISDNVDQFAQFAALIAAEMRVLKNPQIIRQLKMNILKTVYQAQSEDDNTIT